MSTLAAVVLSFVFTTSAKAVVPVPTKRNVGIRVKDAPSQIEGFLEQILGIRVKVRV
jgi:hypothetical protein